LPTSLAAIAEDAESAPASALVANRRLFPNIAITALEKGWRKRFPPSQSCHTDGDCGEKVRIWTVVHDPETA
jgi:hypothetical protein